MARIIVAGAGHGGLVAAIKLARSGHNVTVFEKSPKDSLGLPQKDVFEKNTFDGTNIELPEDLTLCKNRLTLIPLEASTVPLTMPQPEKESLKAERKALIMHLMKLAEVSGVEFIYDCEVLLPIILGSRVAGIKTSRGNFYGDAVIDSCGVDSPLRCNLPDFMCINRPIKNFDIVYTYRAYFKKNTQAPQPKTDYDILVENDGTVGFSWVITEEDCVDILICRFTPLSQNSVLEELRNICGKYPHIGTEFIRGGLYIKIPVCQPLGVLVADGYAAVGDSAFMTAAVKGSGITYSIKAGSILADTIINDTDGLYNIETLWNYQCRFFKEIGFSAARLAVAKNLMTYFTAREINDLLKEKILTTDDINQIMTEKFDTLFEAQGRALIKEKIRQVRENPILKEKFSDFALWIGRLAVTETYFPNKYDRKDVQKWIEKYNDFFDSIRKTV